MNTIPRVLEVRQKVLKRNDEVARAQHPAASGVRRRAAGLCPGEGAVQKR